MKLRLFPLPLGVLGFISLLSLSAQGPDDKGSVLRSPFDAPPPPSRTFAPPSPGAPARAPSTPSLPATPDYLKSIFPDAVPVEPGAPGVRRGINPDEISDINRDLQVTPAAGPWLIMVISYPGKDGAAHARKMCFELKATHRVPAYVFVFGAKEQRQEYERAKKILDEQQALLKAKGLTLEEAPRLNIKRIELQHAVLIGGYSDDVAANKALTKIRGWSPPDPDKVVLETMFYRAGDTKDKKGGGEIIYVNPFKRAFVCRNPTIEQQSTKEAKLDIAALRRLNADESFSLLNCRKPFTLAVKEFDTPRAVVDRATPSSIWEKVGITSSEHKDPARESAHNLAEALRKMKFEAYVLHSKFSSTVTIGSFDGPNDPTLRSTQESLAARFNDPRFTTWIKMMPRPVPMAVPH
jgi:hypothetical protein